MIKVGDRVRIRDYPSWGVGLVTELQEMPLNRIRIRWPEHGELVTLEPEHRLLTEDEWPEPRSQR